MIRRFLGYLSQEVKGLHSAAYILAGAALLSSFLALARDRLLAHTFGAGVELDVYYAAFRIPDLIFVGTGALVSVYILIPELARRAGLEQRRYFDTILIGFIGLAVVVSAAAAAVAPWLLERLYPEFLASGQMPVLVLLTRIMLMQPIFLGVSNIFAAVTQARGRYTLYAITPLVYNIGIIVGLVYLYPLSGMSGLAWGVVAGAALHMGIQIPSVWRDGFMRHVPRVWDMGALAETAFVSLPRALTLSMTQVSFLGLSVIAAVLAPGSIAIFMFAYNLQAVPLAVIGASYSVAAFPTLAAALSAGEKEHFLDQVGLAARYVLFWSVPATALLIVLRAYAVRVVLGSGAFDWTDTRLTAAVFAVLVFSLTAQGISLLLIRAYYAAGRTFVPFAIAAMTALLTVGVAALSLSAFDEPIVFWIARALLRLSDVPGSHVLALAIGFTVAASVGTFALAFHFERRFGGFFSRVARTAIESLCAAVVSGIAAYLVLMAVGPIDIGSTTGSVFVRGFAGGAVGLIVALICYWALGSREFGELVAAARTRLPRVALLGFGAEVAVTSSAEDQA